MRRRLTNRYRQALLARFAFPRDRIRRRLANIVRGEREFRSGKIELKSIPYVLFLDVACMCTLKCPLCYVGQGMGGRPRGLMSMETFCRAIDAFRYHAVFAHLYIRGEPLMNSRLQEMIAYANKARLITSVSTNLNLLNEETAEHLIDSGLKSLVVSLDGATEGTYRTYRVGGDFSKVLKNIRILKRKKREKASTFPKITIQFLVFKFNVHEVPKIRELAASLGVHLSIQQGCMGGPGYEPFTGEHSYESVQQWIVPLEVFLATLARHEDRPSLLFDFYRDNKALCDEKCLFLWKTAMINWDGSVSPCCFVYHKDLDFGNINEEPFQEIWNNPKFQRARSLFQDSTKASDGPEVICNACCLFQKRS